MNRVQRCAHWIFDMDGTLTVPAHDFSYARQMLNIAAHEDILSALAKRTNEEQKEAAAWLANWELEIARAAVAQQDAVCLLDALTARGCTLGVVTRNTRPNALITLRAAGLEHWFRDEDVLGRESAPPKPKPDALNELLQRWGAAPNDAVMVGDYIHDVRAGNAAGMASVLVLRGATAPSDEEADWVVRSLNEVV